jgi:carboxypeptidase C (cathepsin A)
VDTTGKVSNREVTWASKYHLLFIDNPLGAGFSFAVNQNEMVTTETEMADHLYYVLQTLAEKYPTWFTNRDFYIAGESYAGKYVPVMADRILNENAKAWWTRNYVLPLKGVAIGNGWTDPYNQLGHYT